ncbi:MAG: DNA-binding domain-containing protein [Burkholderiales bacterium]
MPSLLEAQRAFGAALLEGGGPQAMAVYRGTVFGNWTGALASAYPVVRRIVGKDYFDALARRYANAHPSEDGDLNAYGESLARFVAEDADVQDLPYLPDVARLEWLAHRAHFAGDPAPFEPGRAAEARLAPACGLLAAAWPVATIWNAHQPGGDPAAVDLRKGAELALVHRPGWRAEVLALGAGDYRFLDRLLAGAGLGTALEAAVAAEPAYNPGTALARWVPLGVITQ